MLGVTHSCLNLSASVGGEIQSLAWDPTGERLAVILKGLSHFSSVHPGEPRNYYIGAIFSISFNNSSPSYLFPSGDPQAANRPAIIAVFKTRTNPIFELLPWFVLLCTLAVYSCAVLVELTSIAFPR